MIVSTKVGTNREESIWCNLGQVLVKKNVFCPFLSSSVGTGNLPPGRPSWALLSWCRWTLGWAKGVIVKPNELLLKRDQICVYLWNTVLFATWNWPIFFFFFLSMGDFLKYIYILNYGYYLSAWWYEWMNNSFHKSRNVVLW